MNAVRAIAVASVVTIVLAACGGDDDEPAADTTTPAGTTTEVTFVETTSTGSPPTTELTTTTVDLAIALADRTFLSTAVEGYQLVEGSQIMLTFQADRIGASAGCNQMSSTWSLDGDVLVVPDMATTDMACEPAARMDQDTWLAAVLTSGPTVAIDGDVLTLTAEGAAVTLSDNPDRPVEDTVWQVEGLVSGDAVSSLPAGVRVPTLVFTGGQVQVDAGCNTGSGSAEVGAADIVFGPIATTRMACDEAASQVESHVLAVLQGTVGYTVEDDVLTLTNSLQPAQGLVLRAAAGG